MLSKPEVESHTFSLVDIAMCLTFIVIASLWIGGCVIRRNANTQPPTQIEQTTTAAPTTL